MTAPDVRRLLGRPARSVTYDLKQETHVDWRYLDGPNTARVFTVVFGPDDRVQRTASGPDPEASEHRGGG